MDNLPEAGVLTCGHCGNPTAGPHNRPGFRACSMEYCWDYRKIPGMLQRVMAAIRGK